MGFQYANTPRDSNLLSLKGFTWKDKVSIRYNSLCVPKNTRSSFVFENIRLAKKETPWIPLFLFC